MAVGRGGNFQLTPLSPSRARTCLGNRHRSGRSSLGREQQKKKKKKSSVGGPVLSAVNQQQPRGFLGEKVGERLGTITPRRRKDSRRLSCRKLKFPRIDRLNNCRVTVLLRYGEIKTRNNIRHQTTRRINGRAAALFQSTRPTRGGGVKPGARGRG
jgi:hypothetical protein